MRRRWRRGSGSRVPGSPAAPGSQRGPLGGLWGPLSAPPPQRDLELGTHCVLVMSQPFADLMGCPFHQELH